jgi:hypothetical protein
LSICLKGRIGFSLRPMETLEAREVRIGEACPVYNEMDGFLSEQY